MISINKKEAELIRAKFPDIHIVRTMKQRSSRHRYYCEENRRVVGFLNRLRGNIKENEGERHTNRKKAKRV